MGGHYGSVQLRTENRAAVLTAAEAVAREMNIKCLVGPPLNGWVGVYPEGNGQDDTVGEHIAARVGGHGLHLLVHDDDVLAYWLWHNGELVDRYWSAPGYFGEENRADEEPLVGDAERFEFVLDARGRERFGALLARQNGATFESERLHELAQILGIKNSVSAFEYLIGGERDGIIGWKRFSEIPLGRAQAEKAKRAAEKARIKSERAKLRAAGLLLVSDERKQRPPTGCNVADGFIVIWQGLGGQDRRIDYHRPPYKLPCEPFTLELPQCGYIAGIAADRTGKRLAISGDHAIRIWDWSENRWALRTDIEVGSRSSELAFSFDGRLIAYIVQEPRVAVVFDISVGQRITTIRRLPMDHQFAFTPDGKWLAQAAQPLGIQSLQVDGNFRSVGVHGIAPSKSNLPLNVKADIGNTDFESLISKKRDEFEKEIETITRQNATLSNPKTPEQIAVIRTNFEKVLASMQKGFAAIRDLAINPTKYRSEHCFCIGFDIDGRWMWIGTEIGLRVYDCAKVMTETADELPSPVWSFDLPGMPATTLSGSRSGYVYAAAGEPNGEGVVFGGLTGELFRLRLVDGKVDRLIGMPGGGSIFEMSMSVDGSTLGVNSGVRDRHGVFLSSAWEIWNYRALLHEAGATPLYPAE